MRMQIIDTWRKVMFDPVVFFRKLKVSSHDSRRVPTVFYLKIASVSLALMLLSQIIIGFVKPELIPEIATFGIWVYALILLVLLPIAVLFSWGWLYVDSAITHSFARLFGARKTFAETFVVTAYSSAPSIFQVIPIVGWIAIGYSVFLTIVGLREQQEMSLGGAVVAVLIPIVITILAVTLLFFLLMGSIKELLIL